MGNQENPKQDCWICHPSCDVYRTVPSAESVLPCRKNEESDEWTMFLKYPFWTPRSPRKSIWRPRTCWTRLVWDSPEFRRNSLKCPHTPRSQEKPLLLASKTGQGIFFSQLWRPS